eukprot:m51a1_g12578 hypothetical protein (116) ;mRNA; f:82-429
MADAADAFHAYALGLEAAEVASFAEFDELYALSRLFAAQAFPRLVALVDAAMAVPFVGRMVWRPSLPAVPPVLSRRRALASRQCTLLVQPARALDDPPPRYTQLVVASVSGSPGA